MTHTRHKPKQKRKVEITMKTGKITAKLRDAVPVCLMVNGEEVKRYKNIELPDELLAHVQQDTGCEIRRYQISFTGVCPNCLQKH